MFELLASVWFIALSGTTVNTCNDSGFTIKECGSYINETAVREYPTTKAWTGYNPKAGK